MNAQIFTGIDEFRLTILSKPPEFLSATITPALPVRASSFTWSIVKEATRRRRFVRRREVRQSICDRMVLVYVAISFVMCVGGGVRGWESVAF